MLAWNPTAYLKFQSARLRPALDLIASAAGMFSEIDKVKNVLDLGCGPGNITPFLCHKFQSAMVEGVDSSPLMIDKASKIPLPHEFKSRISFRTGDVDSEIKFNSKKYDLVYSNAVLHWCENHEKLIPNILHSLVEPNGGVLAFQIPDTINQASHLLMETAALRCGLLKYLEDVRIARNEHTADWYYKLLSPYCKEVDIWSTEYVQQLPAQPKSFNDTHNKVPARHPVLEFTRSTGLRPIMTALGGELDKKCQKYLNEYDRLLEEQYPILNVKNKYHSQGKLVVLMPFKRFFLVCKT